MLTEDQILTTLDNSGSGEVACFLQLGHPYSYLIDSRLNAFKGDKDRWAIAGERLGYNPRGSGIYLEVFYYGNCLQELYYHPIPDAGYNILTPIDRDSFNATLTEEESIRLDADFWLVRGTKVSLSHNKQEYLEAGIELKEYNPNEITVEEAARLIAPRYQDLFRATDEELYQSIPTDLKKILVLDEWYHKDYAQLPVFQIEEEEIRAAYEMNKQFYEAHNTSGGAAAFTDYESFAEMMLTGQQNHRNINQREWDENRPSLQETWQQLAKVVVTGDISLYKPTLEPNTHWKHWPDSGSL